MERVKYPLPGRSLVATLRDENWSLGALIGDQYRLGQWLELPTPQCEYRSFGDVLFDRAGDPSEVRSLAGT